MPQSNPSQILEAPANALDINEPHTAEELAHRLRVVNSIMNIWNFKQAFGRRADELASALDRFKQRKEKIGISKYAA